MIHYPYDINERTRRHRPMLYLYFDKFHYKEITTLGMILGFFLTCLFLRVFIKRLPKDGGRAHAVNGEHSQGKPRGAGIIFIMVFCVLALFFTPANDERDMSEIFIYMVWLCATMLGGYLDDRAKKPWSERRKAVIDVVIAFFTAFTYMYFHTTTFTIMLTGQEFTLSRVAFVILAVTFIFISINVTNCTDGVDGLSGSLTIITLISFYIIFNSKLGNLLYGQFTLLMASCVLGYLWFNAPPSRLMMGDAGARAIGLFIAILALETGSPFIYVTLAAVFLFDGGIGLAKVFLIRHFKIHLFKNTRTPLHDHVRKNKGWSDSHTVFRFLIIQVVVSFMALYLLM